MVQTLWDRVAAHVMMEVKEEAGSASLSKCLNPKLSILAWLSRAPGFRHCKPMILPLLGAARICTSILVLSDPDRAFGCGASDLHVAKRSV